MQTLPKSGGFSLLELMIVIGLVGLLMALSVPSYRSFTQNTRVTAAQNDFVTALNLARAEALRRGRPVSVCASTDGESCATSADWVSGWIVFTDRPGAAAGAVDAGDEVLQRFESLNRGIALTVDQPFIQFTPTGVASGGLTLTAAWTGCKGENKREVRVLASGLVNSRLLACP